MGNKEERKKKWNAGKKYGNKREKKKGQKQEEKIGKEMVKDRRMGKKVMAEGRKKGK